MYKKHKDIPAASASVPSFNNENIKTKPKSAGEVASILRRDAEAEESIRNANATLTLTLYHTYANTTLTLTLYPHK